MTQHSENKLQDDDHRFICQRQAQTNSKYRVTMVQHDNKAVNCTNSCPKYGVKRKL